MVEIISLALAFFTGAISFLSPCIIPMIILYFTTITGFSLEELLGLTNARDLRRKLFYRTLAFVAAFTLVFTLVGGLAGFAGFAFSQYADIVSRISGVLFIALGLQMTGLLKIPWLEKHAPKLPALKAFRDRDGTLNYAGVFIIGFLFALVCVHCISPTIVPTIALAASTATPLDGMLVLLAFSIGLAIPFLLAALFLEPTLAQLKKFKAHYAKIMLAVGLVLIAFGLLMALGKYYEFVSVLTQLIPWKLGGI